MGKKYLYYYLIVYVGILETLRSYDITAEIR